MFKPCLQFAILYTNGYGEAMIRVMTLQLDMAKKMADLFRHVDLFAVVKFSVCQVAHEMFNPASDDTIRDHRDQLTNAVTEILYTYRHECAESTNPTQLVLPESLKLLPMFTLCLIKHPILREKVSVDSRVFHMSVGLFMGCHHTAKYIYPH